jgi:hypothetical protein
MIDVLPVVNSNQIVSVLSKRKLIQLNIYRKGQLIWLG